MKYHGVILGTDSGAPAAMTAKEWLELGGPFCHQRCLKLALKIQRRGMLARPPGKDVPSCWRCWQPLERRTVLEAVRDWVID